MAAAADLGSGTLGTALGGTDPWGVGSYGGDGARSVWAPARRPPRAHLGHAWHAARGPVRSVCAPRAPIGMREPARRGREAGALAGRAGEAVAGHVLTRSARVGTAASREGETEEGIRASSGLDPWGHARTSLSPGRSSPRDLSPTCDSLAPESPSPRRHGDPLSQERRPRGSQVRGRPRSRRPLGFPARADGQGPARTLVSKSAPEPSPTPEGVRGGGFTAFRMAPILGAAPRPGARLRPPHLLLSSVFSPPGPNSHPTPHTPDILRLMRRPALWPDIPTEAGGSPVQG